MIMKNTRLSKQQQLVVVIIVTYIEWLNLIILYWWLLCNGEVDWLIFKNAPENNKY